jgi:hypothetical protein
VATSIKVIRLLNSRQLLIYPKDKTAREALLKTGGWLASLRADPYSRSYYVVVHGVDKALEPDEIASRLQRQNSSIPGLFIDPQIQWLGRKPSKTGSIKIGLKCPTLANKLIQQGLVLDYEIKSVYQYRPLKRCHRCHKTGHKQTECPTTSPRTSNNRKTFYTEKETPISTTFQAGPTQSTQPT